MTALPMRDLMDNADLIRAVLSVPPELHRPLMDAAKAMAEAHTEAEEAAIKADFLAKWKNLIEGAAQ